MSTFRRCVLIPLTLASVATFANDPHENHSGHGRSSLSSKSLGAHPVPVEGGQSAFASLIEIVDMLERDPHTDWAKVDIDVLRAHLVDMDRLVLGTEAGKRRLAEREVQFDIKGPAAAIGAIHRMVVAHSRYLDESRGWRSQVELISTGASLLVAVGDKGAADKLYALGFYGYMSLDSHHQQHHLLMATGGRH